MLRHKFCDLPEAEKKQIVTALLDSALQTCMQQNVVPCAAIVVDPANLHCGGVVSLNMEKATLIPILIEGLQALCDNEGVRVKYVLDLDGTSKPVPEEE